MSGLRAVSVSLGDRTYQVRIGPGLLADVGRTIVSMLSPRKVAIVTDDCVGPLYGDTALQALGSAGLRASQVVVPAGETSKDWLTAGRVLEELAAARLERGDAIVALGGGVVGDLAGFCAATYLRGIGYLQVPTTLLAQVDSSVGGKTGLDLGAGKNLVGAFWQPVAVLADSDVLGSLPDVAWADGLAEIVKTGFLTGAPFLSWLELNIGEVREGEAASVAEAVEACVRFKAGVVEADEHEKDGRAQLNLGHTLGHAVERLEGFRGVSHGVAVAHGLRFAAWLAERLGLGDAAWRARQERLLDAARIPEPPGQYSPDALVDAMRSDKKARSGSVRFVLTPGPGRYEVRAIDEETLAESLRVWESERQAR